MAVTLEEMALRFTTDGEAAVLSALENIDKNTAATAATIDRLGQSMRQAGQQSAVATQEMTEGMARTEAAMSSSARSIGYRLNSVFVSVAFAADQLANGSERGIMRAMRALALLGFAFGPVVGTATTLVAIIGEHLADAFGAAQKSAEKAKAAIDAMVRSAGEAGKLDETDKRLQQFFSGDKYADAKEFGEGPEAERIAGLIRGGGISALQQRLAQLRSNLPKPQGAAPGSPGYDIQAEERYNAALAKQDDQIRAVQKDLDLLTQAHTKLQAVEGEQLTKQTGQDTAKLAADRYKQSLDVARENHQAEMKLSADNYNRQLALATEWVSRMKGLYGENSVEYAQALNEQRELTHDHQKKLLDDWWKTWQEAINQSVAADKARLELQLAQAKGNMALQLQIMDQYLEEVASLYGMDSSEYYAAMQERVRIHDDGLREMEQREQEHNRRMEEFARQDEEKAKEHLRKEQELARTVSENIQQMVSAAFQPGGFKTLVKEFIGKIAESLGEFMMVQGGIYDYYGAIMQSLAGLLTNPFTAGPGAIAIGAALVALGASLGASARSSAAATRGGATAGAFSASTTYVGYVNPFQSVANNPSGDARHLNPSQPVTYNVTVIGKDDPQAQRQIMELIARAGRRGVSNG